MRRFISVFIVSIVLAGSHAAWAVEQPMTDKTPETTPAVSTTKPKEMKNTSAKKTRSTRPAAKTTPEKTHPKHRKTAPAAATGTTTGAGTTVPQPPTGKP